MDQPAGHALGRAAVWRHQDSGYGSEGGPEALEACLNTRDLDHQRVSASAEKRWRVLLSACGRGVE